MTMVKFQLGEVVATPGALDALSESNESVAKFVRRHMLGDWGDLSQEDKQANEEALLDEARILSAYHTAKGTKIWVITDADRSVTTLLLPEEY